MEEMRINPDMSLSAAVALLIQNQAAFLGHMRAIEEKFNEIQSDFQQIKAILARHERILADLPEAIRQRLGFKSSP